MNLTLSRRLLRWLDPQKELERQEFRMCLTKNAANAEDIERTIVGMNGSLRPRLAGMKLKDPA